MRPALITFCLIGILSLDARDNYPALEALSKEEAALLASRLFESVRQRPSNAIYDSLDYLITYFDIDSLRSDYYLNRGKFELFYHNNTRTALQFLTNARQISAEEGDTANELSAMVQIAQLYNFTHISAKSVQLIEEIKVRAEELQDSTRISAAYFLLAQANPNVSDYNVAMFKKSLEYYGQTGRNLPKILANIGQSYLMIDEPQLDSALHFLHRANLLNDSMQVDPSIKVTLVEAHMESGNYEMADSLLNVALDLAQPGDPQSLLPLTVKVELLNRQGRNQEVSKFVDQGLMAIASQYYDDYDIRDFCRASKSALYASGDLVKIRLLDSMETSVQDSILMYVEEASIGIAESSYAIGELESEIAEKDQEIKMNRQVIMGLAGMLLIGVFSIIAIRRQLQLQGQLKAEKAQSNLMSRKNEELEAKLLAHKVDQQERQLSGYVLNRLQQTETLEEVLERMKTLQPTGDQAAEQVTQVIGLLENNLKKEDHWQNFLIHFENIHPNFYSKLKDEYPDLSKQDRRILAYLRMELSTKEIAQLLGINYESVNTSRYRIRKKLGLPKELELDDFVANL
ncbi:MAG: LuxR C-terminal-related transcriptional regulator [Bacteroidota bacterium]